MTRDELAELIEQALETMEAETYADGGVNELEFEDIAHSLARIIHPKI